MRHRVAAAVRDRTSAHGLGPGSFAPRTTIVRCSADGNSSRSPRGPWTSATIGQSASQRDSEVIGQVDDRRTPGAQQRATQPGHVSVPMCLCRITIAGLNEIGEQFV